MGAAQTETANFKYIYLSVKETEFKKKFLCNRLQKRNISDIFDIKQWIK
jgi:hypothetical protein